MARFVITEVVSAYRDVYIEAKSEKEARRKWLTGDFDYSDCCDFEYGDDVDIASVEEVEEDE